MTTFTQMLDRVRVWTIRLPASWGVGHIELHSSLLLTLPGLASAMLLLSYSQAGMFELRSAAITLPVVWLASLMIRVAAQQLALGAHANQSETVIGPAGNLSTDYEHLDAPVMFSYALAGQVATASLVLLGFIVSAAIAPLGQLTLGQSPLTANELLDFKCGWNSRAWASQIMWVNLFVGSLHILPTVPFDMRGLIYSIFKIRNRRSTQPQIYTTLSSLDSHLCSLFLGAGLCCTAIEWNNPAQVTGWYALLAASVYLFVGGRWEATRAAEIDEELAAHRTVRVTRRDSAHVPHRDSPSSSAIDFEAPGFDDSSKKATTASPPPHVDVDEILRKLHREGHEALTVHEREALLTASKQLKEKRNRP